MHIILMKAAVLSTQHPASKPGINRESAVHLWKNCVRTHAMTQHTRGSVSALITRFRSTLIIFRASDLWFPRRNNANSAKALNAATTKKLHATMMLFHVRATFMLVAKSSCLQLLKHTHACTSTRSCSC